MDTRQLRTLEAIAKYGTFASAANAVALTPSAVGQQINALEQELDVRLFDRATRPPTLTPEGIQVLEMAKKILRIEEEAKLSLKGETVAGTLMIGSVRSSALSLLPSAIVELRQKYPNLKPNLRVSLSSHLVADVASGHLDAAMVAEHINLPTSLRWSPFLREPLWIIAPPGMQLEGFKEMLSTRPFVRFKSGVPLSSLIETEISRLGINTLDVAELDTINAIITCVRQGMGISIVPHVSLAEFEPGIVQKVPFGAPQITRQIGIVERNNCHRAGIIQELHTLLTIQAGEFGVARESTK